MWFSLGGRRLFCFVLFGFRGVLYIFFPLGWGGGCFWYFLPQISSAQPAELATSPVPVPSPHERWPRNRRLLTVFTGLRLPLGYHDHLGIFVKIAWTVCPPRRRVTCGIENRSRDLDRKGQHFSPPVLPLSFPLPLLSCCGSVFHFDSCQHVFT